MSIAGISYLEIKRIIEMGLLEDIGVGDITTERLIGAEQRSRAVLLAKGEGVLAGIEVSAAVFKHLDPEAKIDIHIQDGQAIRAQDMIATISGRTRALLSGERLALNLVQRMSGIATQSRYLSGLISDQHAVLVDTRKTTPGLRSLEKYAVRVGGAANHRFALYDGVMLKDNHIHAAGGIMPAVQKVRCGIPHTMRIEVEVENLAQLEEALQAGADIVMLDNMDIAAMTEAVKLTRGRALLEASGGITAANLEAVAATGVNYISMGALTHSAPNVDISLKFVD
ncbi:MAG: carboxylating nicotinate-nucleotide diphosphorylase [Syntrophomonadaceae bacterium]|nr:carboxylating nicotinate-nucleotide diphosphorylase [Syntrophomonadaceae bacterium]